MAKKDEKTKTKKKAVAKKKTTAKKTTTKKKAVKKSKVKLISFTMGATVPTMSFGNVPFSITVEAPSIEAAEEVVLPKIEEYYRKYSVELPSFIKRNEPQPESKVTVTEKKVEAPKEQPKAEEKKEEPKVEEKKTEPAKTETDKLSDDLEKSPAFAKASGAVSAAHSLDALDLIQAQITRSKKLKEDEKPVLMSEVLKKRKELKTA